MRIRQNRVENGGLAARLSAEYNTGRGWVQLPEAGFSGSGFEFTVDVIPETESAITGKISVPAGSNEMTISEAGFQPGDQKLEVSGTYTQEDDRINCRVTIRSCTPVVFRLNMSLPEGEKGFHVIPCNIYGDNNEAFAHAGEFPLLTKARPDDAFRSPFWSFRADRAATPLSAVCGSHGVIAVAADAYAQPGGRNASQSRRFSEWSRAGVPDGTGAGQSGCLAGFLPTPRPEILHNGLHSAIPGTCGASVGYINEPFTFRNKRTPEPAEAQGVCEAETDFRLYLIPAEECLPEVQETNRFLIHRIIRREYALIHHRAEYKKSFREAVSGCLNAFLRINWDPEAGEYTNRECLPPERTALKPWRNVIEIGWTGGGVLAYPLIAARNLLGEEANQAFAAAGARTGEQIISRILDGCNEKSGLLYDLTVPGGSDGSRLNGWWTYFGLVKDCHCAYNIGSAVHYVLKSIDFLKRHKGAADTEHWLDVCRKVCDTVISLQREDGAFGYTFSPERKAVLDWDGFAGCWFVPCLAYLWRFTGEKTYLEAAKQGIRFYRGAVRLLTPSGTPMDTWKSTDQEGNLAFIRGARLLYEETGEAEFLEDLKTGAEYEFLWRYAYQTHPDYAPIREGWSACGGSVTSVSNPHIHPMGMIVDSDLYYLGRVTGDSYYTERAKDGTAWIMQTLELYPEKTGYGAYGVLSERWCPSDGLTVQRDSEGHPFSSWYSYNLWAAAAAFEEACERLEETKESSGNVLHSPSTTK